METLYSKYRPRNFNEVFGQNSIKDFFINSIGKKNFHHAFIFSGPRGTGKTTIARIVAKTLNCKNPVNNNPCNECKSCISIDIDSSTDVIEMDAASNRGVDDIRDIQNKAFIRPLYGKYKIFIIDEVHSLTNYAFEALLKLIEEPPSYVIFIFATTQFIKIPDTVRSRCEKMFFKKLNDTDIFNNLKRIACSENINISDEAMSLIVKYSEGIARESVSNLNQLISQFGNNITSEIIVDSFGLISSKDKNNLLKSIIQKDKKELYNILNNLEVKNVQVNMVISEIVKSSYKLINHINDNRKIKLLYSIIQKTMSLELDIRYLSSPYPFLYSILLEVMENNG